MPKAGADSRSDYRKYKSYYLAREESPAGIKKRVERDQARTLEIKAGKLSGPHDPRTVDHKRAISRGGGNDRSNLAILSASANRHKYNN